MTKSDTHAPYLPLFIDAAGKQAVVVGGGRVALRKVRMLAYYGLRICVIASEACPELIELSKTGDIELSLRPFDDADAQGAFLVFAATDDAEVNAHVEEVAQRSGALTNRSDSGQTQVMVPAVVHRGNLQIAISTAGASPLLSRNLRLQLEQEFDSSWEQYTQLLADVRELVIANIDDAGKRKEMLGALGSMDLHERIAHDGYISAERLYEELAKGSEGEIR